MDRSFLDSSEIPDIVEFKRKGVYFGANRNEAVLGTLRRIQDFILGYGFRETSALRQTLEKSGR